MPEIEAHRAEIEAYTAEGGSLPELKLRDAFIKFLPMLAQKWFDWIKWALAIGFLTLVYRDNYNLHVEIIIGVSYLAVLIDFWNFIYKAILEAAKPVQQYLDFLDNGLQLMSKISKDRHKLREQISSDPDPPMNEIEIQTAEKIKLLDELELLSKRVQNRIDIEKNGLSLSDLC
jgi:hypothetical protein